MQFSCIATVTAVLLMNLTASAYQDGSGGSTIRSERAVNNVQPVVVDYGPTNGGPFGSLSQCSVYDGDYLCTGDEHLPKY